ncbi:hypothetical protein K7432_003547 [Basidiobolus ranarum]|uniref:Polysaccharide lyase 14 domain-containing protein n=1 Tax=Basidiobolus ranarum TaxID=34480 RepID=A0ABR2W606_9FUNG
MYLRSFTVYCLLTSVYSQDLIQSLGLKNTWQPSLDNAKPTDPKGGDWNYVSATKASLDNMKVVVDPLTNTTQNVYSVFYPKNSYSLKSSPIGGVEFFSQPFAGQNFDRALLSYEVGFPSDFPWAKGGKLPGIFGGDPKYGCTGGDKNDGDHCFSARLMWRERGSGEVYAYIPNSKELCSNPRATCRDKFGVSLGQGVLLNLGAWNKMQLYIQLNTPGKSNGVLQLYVNDKIWLDMSGMVFRKSGAIAINDILFSTFFGGGDPSYATPIDTYTYYRNIQFSVGDPVQLTSDSSIISPGLTLWSLGISALAGFYYYY